MVSYLFALTTFVKGTAALSCVSGSVTSKTQRGHTKESLSHQLWRTRAETFNYSQFVESWLPYTAAVPNVLVATWYLATIRQQTMCQLILLRGVMVTIRAARHPLPSRLSASVLTASAMWERSIKHTFDIGLCSLVQCASRVKQTTSCKQLAQKVSQVAVLKVN